jgi:hypothetical protein
VDAAARVCFVRDLGSTNKVSGMQSGMGDTLVTPQPFLQGITLP